MSNIDITLNCLIIPSSFSAFSLDKVSITITVPRDETAHFKLLFKTNWYLHVMIIRQIYYPGNVDEKSMQTQVLIPLISKEIPVRLIPYSRVPHTPPNS
ncbi:hypothetical protein RhiirA1_272538 [Rhizophagus irregularis]|uniref:Uncharacterized protein n=1 Tax=Rhizophagus irregularis TaxID=588596 RepID=A0A2N0REG1_9GLOM|nr:hypothetical protein RhiirA1_272538 [Rhizophagus irregularis]